MVNISPARTLQILQHLEYTTGVSVTLTITMATMALHLGDLAQYAQLIGRHTEVRGWSLAFSPLMRTVGE